MHTALTTLTASLFLSLVLCPTLQAEQGVDLSLAPAAQGRIQVTDRTWPARPGEASVCLWKDDKLAAFSLTIDDNHVPDHPFWLALGEQYGWHWTWFIITGKVGGGAYWGSWEQWQAVAEKGHDVQSHSVTHLAPGSALPIADEYAQSKAAIEEHLPGSRCLAFAYPNGNKPPNDSAIAARYYVACRGVRGVLNDRSKINYRDVNSVSNAGGFLNEESHWASFAGMLNPANRQKFRGWYSCHFHGLTDELKAQIPQIMDRLKEAEADVWVAPFREVAQYGQECDTASLKVTQATGEAIHFLLTDQMSDEAFDRPLTVKVRVDPSWSSVEATQGGQARSTTLVHHDGGVYVLVDAVPDRGEVILRGGA